jgi:hypothetical protein
MAFIYFIFSHIESVGFTTVGKSYKNSTNIRKGGYRKTLTVETDLKRK